MSPNQPEAPGWFEPCRSGAAARQGLPCQESDNCNTVILNGSQIKVSMALEMNIKLMCEKYGIERIGFLTLTFADHVQCMIKAQRRFHSLATGVLSKRYIEWIAVPERSKPPLDKETGQPQLGRDGQPLLGRIHFHLVVVCQGDIRTGCDFARVKAGDYRTANRNLRAEWAFWREQRKGGKGTAKAYGFGRTELMPIKSGPGPLGKYIGKYISKHISSRLPQDKSARLVRYSKGAGRWCCKFSFNSPGSWLWRRKLQMLVSITRCRIIEVVPWKSGLGVSYVPSHRFKEWFGCRWAYKMLAIIDAVKLPEYRTGKAYFLDHRGADAPIQDNSINVSNGVNYWPLYEVLARLVPQFGMQFKN